MKNTATLLLFGLITTITQAQIVQLPQLPQPASMQPNVQIGMNPSPQKSLAPTPQYFGQAQMQNQMLVQHDVARNNQQQELLAEAEKEILQKQVLYDLPDNSAIIETKLFRQAFASIDSMLEGKQNLSLKKAVFDAENAWYGGTLSYEYYCTDISNMVDIMKTAIQQEGYSLDNDMAKKWVLHRFMSDTLRLKDDKSNVTFTHLPYEYDFDDPFGKTDYTKFFVTKLMRTRKGQLSFNAPFVFDIG